MSARVIRRLLALLVLLGVVGTLQLLAPAIANAATTSSDNNILNQIPWAAIAAWLIANVLPYLSALLTKTSSWATGVLTMVLALITSCLTELAQNGVDKFDWQVVLVAFIGAAGVAFGHYKAAISGTRVGTWLYEHGVADKPAA